MFTKGKTQDSKIQEDIMSNSSSTSSHQDKASHIPLSILSQNINIHGDIVCNGDIQLDGTVCGDVNTKSLTIGTNAQVTGEILSDSVKISGHVKGRITARIVELMETAYIEGDVVHSIISMEAGAKINGMMSHIDEQDIKNKLTEALSNKQPKEDIETTKPSIFPAQQPEANSAKVIRMASNADHVNSVQEQ